MSQEYINVKEAAGRWGISDRRVRILCQKGKIEGAVKEGKSYRIPAYAMKPSDGRAIKSKDIPPEYRSALLRIDAKRDERLRRLSASPSEWEGLREDFLVSFACVVNRILENGLTEQETRKILSGYPAEGKPLREQLEVLGLSEAFAYVEDLAAGRVELSEGIIRGIHVLVMMNNRREGGAYRETMVRIAGIENEPPQPFMIPACMEWLLKEYEEKKRRMHPLESIARFFMDFEWIHPFADGNERTGRLLLNLELMKQGYPPVCIPEESRELYYEAFRRYLMEQEEGPMLDILAGCVEGELNRYLCR